MTDDTATARNARIALVTGGGSGIGAATARALTAEGWTVVICGRRTSALRTVADATGAHPVVADVSDASAAHHLVHTTVERFGRLDALVLNAGTTRAGTVGELADEDWTTMVETNLTGPFRLLHHAVPHLVSSRGAVVGVSSVSALRASAGTVGYNATKAGFSMLVQSVAVDYASHGVRANVVCPGWTRTEMADAEMADLCHERDIDIEQAYQLATSTVPLVRPASPSEVASTIAWLLSPSASYVNAAVLPVDGGLLAVDPGTLAFTVDGARKGV